MRIVFISLILVFLLIIPWLVFSAENDCPFGLVNDTAPGICARYIDADGTDICDLSEVPLAPVIPGSVSKDALSISEEELKEKTVAEMADIYGVGATQLAASISEYLGREIGTKDSLQSLHDNDGLCTGVAASLATGLQSHGSIADTPDHDLVTGQELKAMKVYEAAELYGLRDSDYANALAAYLGKNVKLTDTFQLLHDNYGLEPSAAKDIALSLSGGADTIVASSIAAAAASNTARLPRYKLIYISLVLVILYFFTLILAMKNRITLLVHRRIWNLVLLVSFVITVILALLLIIRINWGWYPVLPFNVLYWHVETGTVMAVVSVFHLVWNWRYYLAMLKRRK